MFQPACCVRNLLLERITLELQLQLLEEHSRWFIPSAFVEKNGSLLHTFEEIFEQFWPQSCRRERLIRHLKCGSFLCTPWGSPLINSISGCHTGMWRWNICHSSLCSVCGMHPRPVFYVIISGPSWNTLEQLWHNIWGLMIFGIVSWPKVRENNL